MTTKDQIKLENKFVLEFYYFKEQKKLNSKTLNFGYNIELPVE